VINGAAVSVLTVRSLYHQPDRNGDKSKDKGRRAYSGMARYFARDESVAKRATNVYSKTGV
jgi:hypothetical protein